jgi:hypothetical protein
MNHYPVPSKATEEELVDLYKRVAKKKIKRRLSYEVSFWYNGNRETKFFHSAKKMKGYVNSIHEFTMVDIPDVIIEKTWCYRNHHPRHKWWYYSTEPNQFVCYERY